MLRCFKLVGSRNEKLFLLFQFSIVVDRTVKYKLAINDVPLLFLQFID